MATKIDAFPTQRGNPKYGWDKFFNGDVWSLKRGTDFFIEPSSLRVAAYAAAKDRGGKLRTKIKGDEFVIQFIKVAKA